MNLSSFVFDPYQFTLVLCVWVCSYFVFIIFCLIIFLFLLFLLFVFYLFFVFRVSLLSRCDSSLCRSPGFQIKISSASSINFSHFLLSKRLLFSMNICCPRKFLTFWLNSGHENFPCNKKKRPREVELYVRVAMIFLGHPCNGIKSK